MKTINIQQARLSLPCSSRSFTLISNYGVVFFKCLQKETVYGFIIMNQFMRNATTLFAQNDKPQEIDDDIFYCMHTLFFMAVSSIYSLF